MICEVTNFQNVPLKFAGGTGAGGSFYTYARKGMEVIRSYAKQQGADAVIDLRTEFIVFNEGIYQNNTFEGSMGSIFLHGTMIRYTDKKK